MSFSLLNVAGLVVAFIGAVLLYFNAPSFWESNAPGEISPADDTSPEYRRTKCLARCGFILVAVGFLAQLVAAVPSLYTVPPNHALQRTEAGVQVFFVVESVLASLCR